MSAVTHILYAVDNGDPHAINQLLPLVYDELRQPTAWEVVIDSVTIVAGRCRHANS